MAMATHATVMILGRDLSREAEQDEALRQMQERGFANLPGFVSGVWLSDRERAEAQIIVCFASEHDAQSFAEMARDLGERQASLGLELRSVRVNEVLATA